LKSPSCGKVFHERGLCRAAPPPQLTAVFIAVHPAAARDVAAFYLMTDGSILLSLTGATTIADVGSIDNSDIVRFVPTSLGPRSTLCVECPAQTLRVGLGVLTAPSLRGNAPHENNVL